MTDVCLEIKWITLGFFNFKEYILSSCIIGMKFSSFSRTKSRESEFYLLVKI